LFAASRFPYPLADLEPSEKVEVMRRLRAVKEAGGDTAACAQQLSAAMPANRRRGRPAKPFTVTNRSDGRFSCSVPKRPLTEEHARELLERLKPFLVDIRQQAGIASFDCFLGFADANDNLTRAQRTKERMALVLNQLRFASAVKWQAFVAALLVLRDRVVVSSERPRPGGRDSSSDV
jgi:hypothetical protein